MIKLGDRDLNIVKCIGYSYIRRFTPEKAVENLILDWRQFVEEVSIGYKWGIFDYTNDISVRDILQKIYDKISDSGKIELESHVKIIDGRFIEVTTKISRPILRYYENSNHWWYCRIPKILPDDIARDFEAEGIIVR